MRFSILLTLALFAYPAHAVDGVLEINQTCAELTGCFPGDVAGFPVTILSSTPGTSFRLTSDLEVPDTNPGGIHVSGNVHDISIDLNQFSIVRAACLASPDISCMPALAGNSIASGVSSDNGAEAGTSVRNGSVVGMENGLFLGPQSEARNVRTRWNAADGIAADSGSMVSGCSARENGRFGFIVVDGVLSGSVASDNSDDGIAAIRSTLSGNTVLNNGGDGISVSSGSLVERNVVQNNTGWGLNVTSDVGYRANVLLGNTAGTVTGVGVNLGANACNGTATCP